MIIRMEILRPTAIYRGRNGRVPAHPIKESSPDRVFAPYTRLQPQARNFSKLY
jgi:hypothetical protein